MAWRLLDTAAVSSAAQPVVAVVGGLDEAGAAGARGASEPEERAAEAGLA